MSLIFPQYFFGENILKILTLTLQFWREPMPSLVLPKANEDAATVAELPAAAEAAPAAAEARPAPEFEEEDDEMEIEPLFGDDDDFEDSRDEELHKLESHLKRVLDKESKDMDHLTKELSEAKIANPSGTGLDLWSGFCRTFYPADVIHGTIASYLHKKVGPYRCEF
jgi:hypothetical protein